MAGTRPNTNPDLPEKFPEGADDTGEAREKVAERYGVNPRYVSDAAKVKGADAEMFQRVKEGKVTVPEAMRRMDARPLTAKLPEDEQGRAESFLAQPSIPPARAEEMAERLAAMAQEDRLRVYTLHETGDARQRGLARSEVLGLPPEPDPVLTKLGGWALSLRRYAEQMAPAAAAKLNDAVGAGPSGTERSGKISARSSRPPEVSSGARSD